MPATIADYSRLGTVRTDLSRAKAALAAQLLSSSGTVRPFAVRSAPLPDVDRNIVGVGVTEKTVGGRPTGALGVTVYVQMKFGSSEVPNDQLLPESVNGITTDVQEIGLVLPQIDPRGVARPLQGGSSIGYRVPGDTYSMAGTLGGVVTSDDVYYLLSNNHVLADEGRLAKGSPIYQPALLDDKGHVGGPIATLTRFVALDPTGPNKVDAAIARMDEGVLIDLEESSPACPTGIGAAQLGAQVAKTGRTTGFTAGIVSSIDTDIRLPYDTGSYLFESQIAIVGLSPQLSFSAAGDSGAIVVDRTTSAAVGLLFAGSSQLSFANPIDAVTAAVGANLVTA